jgi:hypothetical protein
LRSYKFQWVRWEIDLDELRKLRFEESWTLKRLLKHFRCGQGVLYQSLKKLKHRKIKKGNTT